MASGDKIELSVVSSPAAYVSGGDARIEIAVPAGTSFDEVEVTLNGVDVRSVFGPDPEGNHQLEGVVTGLPLGESLLIAKDGRGNSHRDKLKLVNNPIQGPIFSGPHQQAVPLRDGGQRRRDRAAADPAVADVRDADRRVVRLSPDREPDHVDPVRPRLRRRPHRRSCRRRRWTA